VNETTVNVRVFAVRSSSFATTDRVTHWLRLPAILLYDVNDFNTCHTECAGDMTEVYIDCAECM